MLSTQKCTIDIENLWGETIGLLMVSHWDGDINGRFEETHKYNFIYSIDNQKIIYDALDFKFNINPNVDYWQIIFITMDHRGFMTKGDFYCYTSSDETNNITIKINGNTEKMDIAYANVPACSATIYPDNKMDNTLFYSRCNKE